MNSTSPSVRLVSRAARSPARSIAGPLVTRIGRAQLGGDDHRQAGLAEPGRPGQQHVVGRPVAAQRALEHQLQLLAHLRLPDELARAASAAALASTSRSLDARARVDEILVRLARSAHRSAAAAAVIGCVRAAGCCGAAARRRPGRPPTSAATTSMASPASLPENPRPASACASWSRHGATGGDAARPVRRRRCRRSSRSGRAAR